MYEPIYTSHNKTLFVYPLFFPVKYRKKVFDKKIDNKLREICIEISERYELHFIEIWNDFDQIHLLLHFVPTLTVTIIVSVIKSMAANRIFKSFPKLKKEMCVSILCTIGYYANTFGLYSIKDTIREYIKNQRHNEKNYKKIYQSQLKFDL